MNNSRRWGCLMLGFVGGVMLAGNVAAQSGADAGDQGRYSGLSGSQALQEQMYEDRMREILGEQAQGTQQSQETQRQTGLKGAEESSQKMQQGQGSGLRGDQTIDEKGKTKGQK
jgi:hypothetical protein